MKHTSAITIKSLRQDLLELEVILLDLKELSNKYHICPHCLVHNIIDTSEIPQEHQEEIVNQVKLAQEKKLEIIYNLNQMDLTLQE